MPIYRLQCSFACDTLLPRDRMVITPHFDVASPLPDLDALCEDLATALDTWDTAAHEITVKAYDAQGTPPVYPVGDAIRNVGASPATFGPRELACCLSFYAERNIPRQRGRLYIPAAMATPTSMGEIRPNSALMQKVADLAPIFGSLGGNDVDWCVFSRLNNTMRSVSHWWVDDEWDVMRSRGLRGSTRLTGTVSEG